MIYGRFVTASFSKLKVINPSEFLVHALRDIVAAWKSSRVGLKVRYS